MALVSTGWVLWVNLLGRSGRPSSKFYNLTSADAAAASTDAAAILAALAAVSGGVVAAYRVYENFEENALSIAAAAVNESEVATMSCFIEDQGDKKADYGIPMPLDAIRVATVGANRRRINTANAAVLAYHALFQTGGEATISDGETAGGLIDGVVTSKLISKASAS